jgi:hypothetical protein
VNGVQQDTKGALALYAGIAKGSALLHSTYGAILPHFMISEAFVALMISTRLHF